MSAVDGFVVLGSENNVVVGDKPGAEKATKAPPVAVARKKLSDISSLPQHPKPLAIDEKSQLVSTTTKAYVEQLQKENMTLVQLLADRNKLISISGNELQKLRMDLQKVQQQNLQLAQSNSQMLAELNSGKDKLKVMRHELGCTKGLLKAKMLELEERAKATTYPDSDHKVGSTNYEDAGKPSEQDRNCKKSCNANRKRQSKSLVSPAFKQVKVEDITEEKRPCVRRHSARFKSKESKPSENLPATANVKLSVCSSVDDQMLEDGTSTMCSSLKKEEETCGSTQTTVAQELGRLSIGRPLRQAARKVQSYKEFPLNVKMRRTE